MDITLLVNVTARAWSLDILARIAEGTPCRQAPLIAATGAGRTAFAASLSHLTSLGLLERNPGHGHPLRPEFRLTQDGERIAPIAARIVGTVRNRPEAPLLRRQAAFTATTVAEHFRATGRQVLLLLDSVTRFAMAQREIGLSAGEPPTTKGYTPTVFAEMPKLLERAGPGENGVGSITGIFSVLVEGDDHNEPISDAARGILDGHIVLERIIAERGRFPAINILKSVSRTMPGCNSDEQNQIVTKAKSLLSTYNDMSELIRLGAYRSGSDPMVDEAIRYYQPIEDFLKQAPNEKGDLATGYDILKKILTS